MNIVWWQPTELVTKPQLAINRDCISYVVGQSGLTASVFVHLHHSPRYMYANNIQPCMAKSPCLELLVCLKKNQWHILPNGELRVTDCINGLPQHRSCACQFRHQVAIIETSTVA